MVMSTGSMPVHLRSCIEPRVKPNCSFAPSTVQRPPCPHPKGDGLTNREAGYGCFTQACCESSLQAP